MAEYTTQYEKTLKKHLNCSTRTKQVLMNQFSTSLSHFLEENPDSGMPEILNAFGPPEQMAKILMHEVSTKELVQYKKKKQVLRFVSSIMIVAFVLLTIYVYFIKSIPHNEYNEIIVDEVVSSDTEVNTEAEIAP